MTLKSKKQVPSFKSTYITAELALLFSQSDSEEEFEGFSEEEEEDEGGFCSRPPKATTVESDEDADMDTGFYSDREEEEEEDETARPQKKRRSLLVALRFPVKRLSACKQEPQETQIRRPARETLSQRVKESLRKKKQQEEEEEEEEVKEEVVSKSLQKRDKNIKENKAMLAKLFADLSTVADLPLPTSPPKKKKQGQEKATPRKRKLDPEAGSERRNPSRKARPPENFGVEEKSEPVCKTPRSVDVRRLMEVDASSAAEAGKKKKRRSSSSVGGRRRSQYDVRMVDEITDDDLENVAYRSKDKIWDKENGSSCHQCRQKTLDTKTICRSGFCVGAKGQFCGPCLKNRYGEDVRDVLLNPTWSCPICRDMCNCSLCRRKDGRCATGNLVGLARFNGHDNVHRYLESIQKELQ